MTSFRERVLAVDWARYQHAYGPAEDVPEQLFALAAADEDVEGFEAAVSALWGNVIHQGSRWGVTATTVPFFVELLLHGPKTPTPRHFLVRYLHNLAVGAPEQFFPEAFPLEELTAVVSDLEALGLPQSVLDGEVFDDDEAPAVVVAARDRITAVWERDTFLAVERAIAELVPLIRDDDDDVALSMIALVSSFPRRRADLAPSLWQLSKDSAFVGRRGPALVALARLGEHVIEPARVLMDADDSFDGLFAAAAEIIGSTAPSEIARRRFIGLTPAAYAAECPFTGTVSALASLCVERAPPSDRSEALEVLISLLAAAEGFDKPPFLARVLALVFPTPWKREALTPLQRRALEAAVAHALWRPNQEFLNQNEAFEAHGLPTKKPALEALLK